MGLGEIITPNPQGRIMRLLLVLFLVLFGLAAQADENWYARHYQTQAKGNLASMQAQPETVLYAGKNRQEDNISMLEQGYDLMGVSSFEAGEVSPQQALVHGKNIKADMVLVYADKARNTTPIGQMEFIREARRKGKELTERDLKELPQYSYHATYWAKLPAPLLGVHVIKLVPKDEEVAAAEGVNVVAVIRDSPAAQAGLLRGDVLLALGGKLVNKPEELSTLVAALQGQSVKLEILRDGAPQTVSVTLGTKQ